MRDYAYTLAVALVVAAPLTLVLLAWLTTRWIGWVVRDGGMAGEIGLVVTGAVGVAVAASLTVGDPDALAALARGDATLLAGIVTSLVVVRRSGRGDARSSAARSR